MVCYGLYNNSALRFMLNRFFIVFSFLILLIATVNTPSVLAVAAPDFPVCTNPAGTLRVENDGIHGIAGSTAEYKGKDTVYTVNNTQVLQCLCTDDGEGIQTNWWKASSLNDSDIQTLKNQGWNYIANGALWGLDSAPYMAKNNEYECSEKSGGIGGGKVLGLAVTGDKALFYSLFGMGIGSLFLLLGILLLLHRKGNSDTGSE